MKEIDFWNRHVKPSLNFQDRLAWKVGTSTRAGIPDVIYRHGGEVAWLEMKKVDMPKRETTPITLGISVEQTAHLREWCLDGKGHGFILAAIGAYVYLLPWYVPNKVERDNLDDVTIFSIPLTKCKTHLGKCLDEVMSKGTPDRVEKSTWFELP